MSATNHVQGRIAYCKLNGRVVDVLVNEFYRNNCFKKGCPYLFGSNQGEGVECLWEDGSNLSFVQLPAEQVKKLDEDYY